MPSNFIIISNLTHIGIAQEHMINGSLNFNEKVKFEKRMPCKMLITDTPS